MLPIPLYSTGVIPEPPILLGADHWFDASTENYLNDKITTFNCFFEIGAGDINQFNTYMNYRVFPDGSIYVRTESPTTPSFIGLPSRLSPDNAGVIALNTRINSTSIQEEGVTIFCVRRPTPSTSTIERGGTLYWYSRTIDLDNALDGAIKDVIVNDTLVQVSLQVIYKNTPVNGPSGFQTQTLSFSAGDPSPQIEIVAVKPSLVQPSAGGNTPIVYRTKNGQGVKPVNYGPVTNADPTLVGGDSTRPFRVSNAFPYPGDKRLHRAFGELIVFKRALSVSEIANMENYLKNKWNINY